ncbi:Rrf2 family protein [Bacillus mesophilus]|uniref:Rrf2 family transcriptional regulator n=1 Tax=Bacillus mesophilus TaxID=1808955 RepID=A0A6M0Q3N9_9BACI|nr:Rrf2 family transcriptional regulator [Bacillus mesophilus]MBM7660292.1 Rrf2 family protein [Bacillus mesophilus]NEY71005.1 Rrf2 family transcriptional regulator [Bacillus mesophilus]
MKSSLSVEYAIHSVINLALFPSDINVSVKKLARFMGVTPTYLAKVFTLLTKSGIVRSSIGTKGGVKLAKAPEDISFYDVFIAINGGGDMFQCSNVRAFMIGYEPMPGICDVHRTMLDAEEAMFAHLKNVKIIDMVNAVYEKMELGEIEERIETLREHMKNN